MANRDPEPESDHQQFSTDYLSKYGYPGPVDNTVASVDSKPVESIVTESLTSNDVALVEVKYEELPAPPTETSTKVKK